MRTEFGFHLILDGATTIVKLHVDTEFVVPTASAREEAEVITAQLMAGYTGQNEAELLRQMRESQRDAMWLGDIPRPEEPG